jgi:ATP-dependent DNA ligase
VLPDGRTAFNLIQNATEGSLIFFLFDLLFPNGENLMGLPVADQRHDSKSCSRGHPTGFGLTIIRSVRGQLFTGWFADMASKASCQGASNGRYEPDRRFWLKTRCLNREEFVVVGWSDPEGSGHRIGASDGSASKLIYAGRAGTGMPDAELERLWQRLRPLAIDKMPLSIPPPRGSRYGSPLTTQGRRDSLCAMHLAD